MLESKSFRLVGGDSLVINCCATEFSVLQKLWTLNRDEWEERSRVSSISVWWRHLWSHDVT